MNKAEIIQAFEKLNAILQEKYVKGEVCLYGGAVMCLAYDARASTKDVVAVFHPSSIIRSAAADVAEQMDLPRDWLNDGVKGFLVEHPRRLWRSFSNLTVFAAEAEYLFAMKAIAARVDSSDGDDLRILIRELKLSGLEKALELVEKYYPKDRIKPATSYFLEELFDEDSNH